MGNEVPSSVSNIIHHFWNSFVYLFCKGESDAVMLIASTSSERIDNDDSIKVKSKTSKFKNKTKQIQLF